MSEIVTMKRYELKYIVDQNQYTSFERELLNHMKVDKYGLTSILSIYYDTPDYRLIRTSIEKPDFKEKVRLRSYGLVKPGDNVYLELKRKAFKLVYKRRVVATEESVIKFFQYGSNVASDGQIAKEISYFRNYYGTLIPAILIIYERIAYYDPNSDLRVTFDLNPRYRVTDLNLSSSLDGELLLKPNNAIIEIKVQEAMPLWLTELLSKNKIFLSSFSKVGEAYKRFMNKPKEKKG